MIRVSVVDDSRIPSTSTVTLNRQDHTVTNLLSNEIRKNENVIFSGYRVPHPLVPKAEIRVPTKPNTQTPKDVLKDAATKLLADVNNFEESVKTELHRVEIEGISGGYEEDNNNNILMNEGDQPDEYYVDY